MKLFTEEQMKSAYIKGRFKGRAGSVLSDDDLFQNYIDDIISIELPSDEEIENNAEQFEYTDGIYGFKQGVRWLINKFKNQGK